MTTHSPISTKFSHGYALLIGVDQSVHPRLALPVVTNDVAAMAAVLTDPQVCAYPREQVDIVSGEAVTRDGIFAALDRLRTRLQADRSGNATAVVYYSGHGWRRQRGDASEYYLIPHDVDVARPHRTTLSAREFANEIEALTPRRLLVLLDCCHAHGMGAKDPGLSGDVSSPFPIGLLRDVADASPVEFDDGKSLSSLREGQGRAILSSSRGDERSFYFPDERMSVFTHHLIEALIGHAPTSTGQHEVLVSDILGYLPRQVPRTVRDAYQREQNPEFTASGNFPVAMLLGGKGLAPNQAPPERRTIVSEATARYKIGDVSGQAQVGDGNIQTGDVRANGNVAIGRDITMISRRGTE